MEEKMTSKRRAELRCQANRLEPLFQVGKGGISDTLIAQTEDALRAHELIKLKVLLESAPEKPREIDEKLAEATGSQVVQVIGGSMIFYKENPELQAEKKVKEKVNKSGTGKGAKDFKKKFNAQAKKDEQLKKTQRKSRYSKPDNGRIYK